MAPWNVPKHNTALPRRHNNMPSSPPSADGSTMGAYRANAASPQPTHGPDDSKWFRSGVGNVLTAVSAERPCRPVDSTSSMIQYHPMTSSVHESLTHLEFFLHAGSQMPIRRYSETELRFYVQLDTKWVISRTLSQSISWLVHRK